MSRTTDYDLIAQAYKAAQESVDQSTQIGAVLVNDAGDILAMDCNRFPYHVKETEERWERPLKYSYIEHAERNVIYQAARNGICTQGLIMYCNWYACDNCARAIIQAGIKEVISHDIPEYKEHPQWVESVKLARNMMAEAGVVCRDINARIGGIEIRVNGKAIRP